MTFGHYSHDHPQFDGQRQRPKNLPTFKGLTGLGIAALGAVTGFTKTACNRH